MADPGSIPNLWGRWRASDLALADQSSVAEWPDASGNLRALTQATAAKQPVFNATGPNGKPFLRFDGVDDFLLGAYTLGSNVLTLYVVMRIVTGTASSSTFASNRSSSSTTQGIGQISWRTSQISTYWRNDAGTVAQRDDKSTPTLDTWRVETGHTNPGAALNVYRDGTVSADYSSGTITTDIPSTNRFGVACAPTGTPGEFAKVDVAEVIAYTSAHTAAERAEVHSYIQDTYGITVSDYVATATATDHVPVDAAHGHSADATSLSQVHSLTPVDAAHDHTADATALVTVRDAWSYPGMQTSLEASPAPANHTGSWSHISGPTLTLVDTTSPTTKATAPAGATGASVYRWTVTRTADGATASADSTVTYRAITGPHVALVYAIASDEDDYYPGSVYAGDWEPRIQVGMDLVQEAMARMTAYQGIGRQSFALDRDADGRPVVHFVRLTQTGSFLRGTDDPTVANDDTAIFDEIKLATDARIPTDAIPFAIWGGVRHNAAGTTNDEATVGSLARARIDGSLSAYDAVGLAAVPDTPTAAAMDAALNDTTAIDNTDPAQWWDITDAVTLGGGLNTRWSNAGHLLGGWLHEVSHGCGVRHPDDSPAPTWSIMLFDVLDHFGRWFVHPEPGDALDANPENFTAESRPRYTGSYIGAGTTATPILDTLNADPGVTDVFNAAAWIPAEPATSEPIYSMTPNGSFEKGLTGWSLYTGSASLSQSTEVTADEGSHVLRVEVTATGTVEVISDPVPVAALGTFSRLYSRRSATVERGTSIATRWLNSSGTAVSTTNVTASTAAPIGSWAREHNTTSPTDTTITHVQLRLRVVTPSAGEVFYFDRVELHEGSSADFFGDEPAVALAPASTSHAHTADTTSTTQVHSLAPVDAAHSHSAEVAALTQVHALVPAEASHAHSAEATSINQLAFLEPAGAAHGHAVDSTSLTQQHALQPAEALHEHGVDTTALTQVHSLVPSDAAHSHTADETSINQLAFLEPAQTQHSHTADTTSLTQVHLLEPSGARHNHDADDAALTQVHVVAPSATEHGHTADTASLVQQHSLAPADAAHAHTAEATGAAVTAYLEPDEALHSHSADEAGLTQVHLLDPADTGHAHTAEATTLDLLVRGYPDDATHGHSADTTALTQVHVLAPSATEHGHTADTASLTQAHSLGPVDAVHAHSADATSGSALSSLAPDDADHAHVVEATSLTQVHSLAPASSGHSHSADVTTLGQQHFVEPDDAWHAHAADATLSSLISFLQPADASHAHSASATSATQVHRVEPESAAHGHTAAATLLSQLHLLAPLDAEHAHSADVTSAFAGALLLAVARSLAVDREDRLLLVGAEPRDLAVDREDRTLRVEP